MDQRKMDEALILFPVATGIVSASAYFLDIFKWSYMTGSSK